MVTIVDYKALKNEKGQVFYGLEIQGGIEAVKSQESERIYFTARTATVPSTFNESICKTLIGKTLPGEIKKIKVEPYDYVIPNTNEVIKLSYRYEYIDAEKEILDKQVIQEEEVIM